MSPSYDVLRTLIFYLYFVVIRWSFVQNNSWSLFSSIDVILQHFFHLGLCVSPVPTSPSQHRSIAAPIQLTRLSIPPIIISFSSSLAARGRWFTACFIMFYVVMSGYGAIITDESWLKNEQLPERPLFMPNLHIETKI